MCLLSLVASVAAAEPSKCTFVVAYVDYQADWLVSRGRATVTRSGNRFEAQLFGIRDDPSTPSHKLQGTILSERKGSVVSGRVKAELTNMFSDAGADALAGSYFQVAAAVAPKGRELAESLTVENGSALASIACFGDEPSLVRIRAPAG